MKSWTGWWFWTFVIFHNIWDNPSHWLSYFSRWLLHHQPVNLLWRARLRKKIQADHRFDQWYDPMITAPEFDPVVASIPRERKLWNVVTKKQQQRWFLMGYIYCIYIYWLVVTGTWFVLTFPSVGIVIIPIDFHSIIFHRGRYTTNPLGRHWNDG